MISTYEVCTWPKVSLLGQKWSRLPTKIHIGVPVDYYFVTQREWVVRRPLAPGKLIYSYNSQTIQNGSIVLKRTTLDERRTRWERHLWRWALTSTLSRPSQADVFVGLRLFGGHVTNIIKWCVGLRFAPQHMNIGRYSFFIRHVILFHRISHYVDSISSYHVTAMEVFGS